jgi:hypothetical protein
MLRLLLKFLGLLLIAYVVYRLMAREPHHLHNVRTFPQRKWIIKTAQVTPDEVRNLQSILDEFEKDQEKWDCLLSVGEIYQKGAYPRFLPNDDLAMRCFKVAAMCPDKGVSSFAQAKYYEMLINEVDEGDRRGEELPTIYGTRICNLALQRISTSKATPKPESTTISYDLVGVHAPGGYNRVYFQPRRDQHIHTTLNNNNNNNYTPVGVGAQNVHDHSVVAITKKNLEAVKKTVHASSKEQVRDALCKNSEELTLEEVESALRVIDELGDEKHSTLCVSEKEALDQVWGRIQDIPDKTLRENLVETLGKQLASAVENDHVVCSTGKIARIVGTLEGVGLDDIDNTRPLWTVKDELANLAIRTRDRVLQTLSEQERECYNDGKMSSIEDTMKAQFVEEASKVYIDQLQMNPVILEPLIETYKESF